MAIEEHGKIKEEYFQNLANAVRTAHHADEKQWDVFINGAKDKDSPGFKRKVPRRQKAKRQLNEQRT